MYFTSHRNERKKINLKLRRKLNHYSYYLLSAIVDSSQQNNQIEIMSDFNVELHRLFLKQSLSNTCAEKHTHTYTNPHTSAQQEANVISCMCFTIYVKWNKTIKNLSKEKNWREKILYLFHRSNSSSGTPFDAHRKDMRYTHYTTHVRSPFARGGALLGE